MNILPPDQYQAHAQRAFDDAASALRTVLPARARIEHIGASSIPGAHSKGDLDICVSVPAADYAHALAAIESLGYAPKAGSLRTTQLTNLEFPDSDPSRAVQLIEAGSSFEFFFTFRDRLRSDPSLVAAYNALKHQYAPQGEAAYRDAKSAFISRVLDGDERRSVPDGATQDFAP
jgi:GrpB-like predicted nucleotidyltransferase (UPF0157 family)